MEVEELEEEVEELEEEVEMEVKEQKIKNLFRSYYLYNII
jgi:hypothetical protein